MPIDLQYSDLFKPFSSGSSLVMCIFGSSLVECITFLIFALKSFSNYPILRDSSERCSSLLSSAGLSARQDIRQTLHLITFSLNYCRVIAYDAFFFLSLNPVRTLIVPIGRENWKIEQVLGNRLAPTGYFTAPKVSHQNQSLSTPHTNS